MTPSGTPLFLIRPITWGAFGRWRKSSARKATNSSYASHPGKILATRASTAAGRIRTATFSSRCSSIRRRAGKPSRQHTVSTKRWPTPERAPRSVPGSKLSNKELAPESPSPKGQQVSLITVRRRQMSESVTYYEIVLADGSGDNPAGLARRRQLDQGAVLDEMLRHD